MTEVCIHILFLFLYWITRYVVGQYPRFLRAHWKFLKTVVNKLFEFMHETHPGVQVDYILVKLNYCVVLMLVMYFSNILFSLGIFLAWSLFQDMACDTFLKIVQKCKRKFVILQVTFDSLHLLRLCLFIHSFYLFLDFRFKMFNVFSCSQVGESEPFVSELLTSLPTTIADLEPHQIHSFYESVSSLCCPTYNVIMFVNPLI